jgi:hypothetical protein
MNRIDLLLRSVFRAALAVGYALQHRADPFAFHQTRKPREADRGGAVDDLRRSVEDIGAALGVKGDTVEDQLTSLSLRGGPAWRREALRKVIEACSLVQKADPSADPKAFMLLGQAVWEYQDKTGDTIWERDIRDVWATRPADDESLQRLSSQ